MIKNLLIRVISVFLFLSPAHAYAEDSDWVLVTDLNGPGFYIKKSSVTKIQNSLVFDAYTINVAGNRYQSLDRYIVSCDGNLAAPLSRVPFVSTESKDRLRWLDKRDTTILASTFSLVIDTEFLNDYWFMTKSFKSKIQTFCKGLPKGLKTIEASIVSSIANDEKRETFVFLLDSMRSLPKYREIWVAAYDVDKKPILFKDPETGGITHVSIDDKFQYESAPVGDANSRARYRFQCNEKKIVIAQSVTYSKSRAVVNSQSLTEAQINLNWTEVIPKSTGETLLEFACAL
jgi:hypothetical protein